MSATNNDQVRREIVSMVCGKPLGSGIAREVYVFGPDPDLVIKLESSACSFQNVKEWDTWQRAQDVEHVARWLAPCVMISSCGSVLLQRRTAVCLNYPERMPAFLADFKRENYGMLDGRLVCHDYGTNLLAEHGMTKRMKRARWWSNNDDVSDDSI